MAWKNGAFEFQNVDVPSVLRQLERWYDIRVIYKDGIPPNKINGRMGRNLKIITGACCFERNRFEM